MKPYKARAIVLHTLKYGDNALVAHLLTDTLGRQNYLVAGIRPAPRPGSRTASRATSGRGNKAAHYQPLGLIEIEGYEVPGGEMHRIREVRNALILAGLRSDPSKNAIALFIAEVLYRLVKQVEPDGPLFGFVWRSVAALDGLEGEAVANFHLWFLVRLSSFLGFYPGNEWSDGAWFDIGEGLFTLHPADVRLAIAPRDAAVLGLLMELPVERLGELQLNGARRGEFLEALLGYLEYHLDIHSVQSLAVLREVF